MLVLFEVNLARRLLKVNRLSPAVDVIKLIQKYADLEVTDIPLDVDAVCLNLKKPGIKPVVIVNQSRPPRRRRFTIAHELGHILIPWHRGSIVDDTSETQGHSSTHYQIESEANRFASELLMPEDWIKSLVSKIGNLPQLASDISSFADVSLAAAVFRLRTSLPRGFIFAELNQDCIVKNSWRSPRTISNALMIGEKIKPKNEFQTADSSWFLKTFDGTYWWWKLPETMEVPQAATIDWRKLLLEILQDYGVDDNQRKKAYASVSATAANANGMSGSTVEEIYASIFQRFSSKAKTDPLFDYLIHHPKIERYMASRDPFTSPCLRASDWVG